VHRRPLRHGRCPAPCAGAGSRPGGRSASASAAGRPAKAGPGQALPRSSSRAAAGLPGDGVPPVAQAQVQAVSARAPPEQPADRPAYVPGPGAASWGMVDALKKDRRPLSLQAAARPMGRPSGRAGPGSGQGNRLKPVAGGRDGICAGLGYPHCPTCPACPARRSTASFLPLVTRAIGAGAGGGGGFGGGGGRGWMCKRQVNARRQPLDSKRPGSCPTAGGVSFAQPRSARPGPPPCRKAATKGNGPLRTLLTESPDDLQAIALGPVTPAPTEASARPGGREAPAGGGAGAGRGLWAPGWPGISVALWQGRWPLPGCASRAQAEEFPAFRSGSPCERHYSAPC
jgi:hypothetical protein